MNQIREGCARERHTPPSLVSGSVAGGLDRLPFRPVYGRSENGG